MALVPSSSSSYGIGIVDIGDELPDWTLESQLGSIRCHELIDGKVCLFVTIGYAFDPVTTTEIGAIHKVIEEFEARNITVIILGCDTIVNYRRWCKDIEELQTVNIKYPIVSDESCSVLQRLGCAKPLLPDAKLAPIVNGTFLVDIDKKIRISMKYSPAIGRNIYEVIRAFDALNLVTFHRVVCPSNWGSGQDVFVTNEITDDEAAKLLPKGNVRIKPWFRLTTSNI